MLYISGNLNNSTGFDLLQNLDSLKESLRLAGTGTYNWQDIDISQFQGGALNVTNYYILW